MCRILPRFRSANRADRSRYPLAVSSPDDDRALLDRLSKAAVRIETAGGRPLEDMASYDWRDTTRRDVAAARVQADGATVDPQILDEVHHRQYGRPWALGKYLFDFVVERGLRPADRLLDIGCGALRLGLPAIAYLDRGHYFGVDAHLKSLEAAVTYELPLHGLEHQRPRLLWDDAFAFAHFGMEFDWAVDFATSLHLPKDAAATLFRNAAAVLRPGGRLLVGNGRDSKRRSSAPDLDEIGLELVHEQVQSCLLLTGHRAGWENQWYEYARAER
jgi:SAM-dependent methyltransferase